eukprot:4694534-Pyramimonas_sp.AAC.1
MRGLAGIRELQAIHMTFGLSRHSLCTGFRLILPQDIQGPAAYPATVAQGSPIFRLYYYTRLSGLSFRFLQGLP